MLTFDLCCVTVYNAVSLALHYNAAGGTLWQQIQTFNGINDSGSIEKMYRKCP